MTEPPHPTGSARCRRIAGAAADRCERAERDVILEALRAAHGSRREVAERLGISPRTLRYKLARIRARRASTLPACLTCREYTHEPAWRSTACSRRSAISQQQPRRRRRRRRRRRGRDAGGVERRRTNGFAQAAEARHRQGQRDADARPPISRPQFEKGVPGVELPQVMLEMQKANVSFRALTEVRNRLVDAYQEIMNMPHLMKR